jgi:hypothetical protein
MRITDLHFVARSRFRNLPASYGVLATGPSRSAVIATRFAVRFERGAAVFVQAKSASTARLPQANTKGQPESRPSRLRAYELPDLGCH